MTEMSSEVLSSIFKYDDYRKFLSDYFEEKQCGNRNFSQRYFAKKVGFKAHNFCKLVIDGKRNLSSKSVAKFISALKLTGKAAEYFENLVYLNQAVTLRDKDYYFGRINEISMKMKFYKLNKSQFFFYEKWYYPVIRELMVCSDWNGDTAKLAKMVRPSLSIPEASKAVKLLLESNMIVEKEGKYELNHKFVTSADVPVMIKKKSRRDVILKELDIIDSVESKEKYFAYSTLTMSEDVYEKSKKILDKAREQILNMVMSDEDNVKEIYEVVLQVFPVSSIRDGGK